MDAPPPPPPAAPELFRRQLGAATAEGEPPTGLRPARAEGSNS